MGSMRNSHKTRALRKLLLALAGLAMTVLVPALLMAQDPFGYVEDPAGGGEAAAPVTKALLMIPSMGEATKMPERLEYDISYGMFDVGYSVMEVVSNDDGTVSIITRARSKGWVDDVYPVDDYAETIVESFDTLRPIKYILKTREGKGRKHREVTFDHKAGKAYYVDHIKGIEEEFDVPDLVFDPLAAFFFIRRVSLNPGVSTAVPMFDSKEFTPIEVKVLKRKNIEVPAGIFNAVQISPVMQSEGIFSRRGDIYIWLTDDARRVPVLIKSRVLIGSIKVELKGGKY